MNAKKAHEICKRVQAHRYKEEIKYIKQIIKQSCKDGISGYVHDGEFDSKTVKWLEQHGYSVDVFPNNHGNHTQIKW